MEDGVLFVLGVALAYVIFIGVCFKYPRILLTQRYRERIKRGKEKQAFYLMLSPIITCTICFLIVAFLIQIKADLTVVSWLVPSALIANTIYYIFKKQDVFD